MIDVRDDATYASRVALLFALRRRTSRPIMYFKQGYLRRRIDYRFDPVSTLVLRYRRKEGASASQGESSDERVPRKIRSRSSDVRRREEKEEAEERLIRNTADSMTRDPSIINPLAAEVPFAGRFFFPNQ